MNFKLSNLSVINEKYDRIIELLKDTTWEIFYRTGQLGINCILHEFS